MLRGNPISEERILLVINCPSKASIISPENSEILILKSLGFFIEQLKLLMSAEDCVLIFDTPFSATNSPLI